MFHDAHHAEVVFQYVNRLPHLHFLAFGVNVIHDDVVRVRQIVPFVKYEPAGDRLESFLLNSVHDFESGRIELQQHRRHRLHVFQLFQFAADRNRHRRAAERHKNRRRRRLHHDIRPHTFNALRRFRQQPAGQSDHDDHQRHLDGDGQNSDQRAQRTVQHVLYDHVPNHSGGCVNIYCCGSFVAGSVFSLPSSPTRTKSSPASCFSVKASAASGAFKVSLLM